MVLNKSALAVADEGELLVWAENGLGVEAVDNIKVTLGGTGEAGRGRVLHRIAAGAGEFESQV